MKTVSIILLLIFFSFKLSAQESIFKHIELDISTLNDEQKNNYNKILDHKIYSSIHFIEVQNPFTSSEQEDITIKLPYLEYDNLVFTPASADFEESSNGNYKWYGKMEDEENEKCSAASLMLMRNENRVIGHISVEDRSFEIYDLTGGIQVLCETDMEKTNPTCGSSEETPSISEEQINKLKSSIMGLCEGGKTKILFLYTPAAAALEPDINGKAQLAAYQLIQIFNNSKISSFGMEVAGVIPFNFIETNLTNTDLDLLKSDIRIKNLRTQYKAEVIVVLTSPHANAYGQALALGVQHKDSSIAIVEITTATNSRYTFAHEVGHLYGGRHDRGYDNTNVSYHGYTFRTGDFLPVLFGKKRWTLMAIPENHVRIEHVSNPYVEYLKRKTGDGSNNNSEIFNLLKLPISNFYQDVLLVNGSMKVQEISGFFCIGSQVLLTASAYCGTEPYSFNWYVAENGNWQPIGTGETINYKRKTRYPLIKLVITDALGNSFSTTEFISCPLSKKSSEAIGETVSNKNIQLFPNPNNGKFTLCFNLDETEPVLIELHEIQGKKIQTLYTQNFEAGRHVLDINTINLSSGTYHISIKGSSFKETKTLCID